MNLCLVLLAIFFSINTYCHYIWKNYETFEEIPNRLWNFRCLLYAQNVKVFFLPPRSKAAFPKAATVEAWVSFHEKPGLPFFVKDKTALPPEKKKLNNKIRENVNIKDKYFCHM